MKSQLVFLIGGWVLAAALIPTVLAGGGPAIVTSAITAAVLAAYTVAFAATRQIGGALGSGASAALWCVLLAQAVLA